MGYVDLLSVSVTLSYIFSRFFLNIFTKHVSTKGPRVPILQPLHSITEAAQPAHDGGRGVVVLKLLWTGGECLKKYF